MQTSAATPDGSPPTLDPLSSKQEAPPSVRLAEYATDGELAVASTHGAVVYNARRIPTTAPGMLTPEATQALDTSADETIYPIDLANALGLGGASHLQIQIARERVCQAQADLMQARALWLPSLRFGVGWNRHNGRIQATPGNVLEVSRNALFTGGGLGLGQVPNMGGASGPAPLFVNLSLADAMFAPRVAQNLAASASSASQATFNDSLLEIAASYFDLLQVHGQLANASTGLAAFDEMVHLTSTFEQAGAATKTEVDRARTQRALQEQSARNLLRQTKTSSANLVRQLRLEPTLTVVPVEERVVPVDIVDASLPVSELIAMGIASRPETRQQQALLWAAGQRANQEHWRPWLPNVQVGTSAGSFGGGPSSRFDNQASRSDIDLLAVWELQNLGVGNRALRQRTCSEKREAWLRAQWIRDQIEAEIVAAASDVNSYRQQIEITLEAAEAARDTYKLNLQKIREGEGLPIELLQAITSLVRSLDAYVIAVSDYNRAQFRLVRALGDPPPAPETRTASVEVVPGG